MIVLCFLKTIGNSCRSIGKLFDSCTFQGLNDTLKISSRPCVQGWLNSQNLVIGKSRSKESEAVGFREPEASAVIGQLRKIGATDSARWLAGKRSNAIASDQPAERIQVSTNQLRGDNLCEA